MKETLLFVISNFLMVVLFVKLSHGCFETMYDPVSKTTAKEYQKLAKSPNFKPPKTNHEQEYWSG